MSELLLYKELSDIYSIQFILEERKSLYKTNKIKAGSSISESDKSLDLIISLIYLYLNDCSVEDINYWLKKEWNYEISERAIRDILYRFQSKRLFKKSTGIYVLNTEKVKKNINKISNIVEDDGLFYTNSLDNIEYFIYFSGTKKEGGRKKINIGSLIDIVNLKKIDGENVSIEEALSIKRFNYAYNQSDMAYISTYEKITKNKMSIKLKNELIINSQFKFNSKFNKIKSLYFS